MSSSGMGMVSTSRAYGRYETIFTPGDACDGMFYIRSGGVNLSDRSKSGKDTVVATLGPGEFFGERAGAGQTVRAGTATAITPSTILFIATGKRTRRAAGYLRDRIGSSRAARRAGR